MSDLPETGTNRLQRTTNGVWTQDSGLGLHQHFEWQVLHDPSPIAVVDGAIRLSYRELNESANRLARHLASLGVGPEVIVGIYLGRSHHLIVTILAVLKTGGANGN